MTTLTCLAVDDELSALETIESYIFMENGLIYLGGQQDSTKAFEFLSHTLPLPDILFLDLEMKGTRGDRLAELVKGKVMIVFTTGHADFAVQSYEYGTIDYLLKPFSYERFKEAVEKCRRHRELSERSPGNKVEMLLIKDSLTGKMWNIPKDDILYITAYGNYCKVFISDSEYIMPLISLVKMYESLNSTKFMRVHRSWVIHISQVQAFSSDSITLKNGIEIKLGRVYRKPFRKWFDNNL